MDGSTTCYTLELVKYCKQAKVDRTFKGGSDVQNNVVINQDGKKIVFDRCIKTHDGWVHVVDMLPSEVQFIEYVTSNVDSVVMKEVGIM